MTQIVKLKPMDPKLKNSTLMDSTSQESTVMMDVAGAACIWNGQEYPEGTLVECDGARYECAFGRWVRSG